MLNFLNFYFMVAHVTGNASFPKPLSPEEEKYYLEKYVSGDQEARNILIERNLRLVAHIVKKYSNINQDTDDLISIGTIGLIKGINTYKMDHGTKLATYAARCIDNEILMNIRSTKKFLNDISLQETIGVDKDGNEVKIEDRLTDTKDTLDEQVSLKLEIIKLYDSLKSVLKEREKLVIEDRYGLNNGHEKTQREIAETLGISRSYVSRIEKKAIKKLISEMTP